MTTTTKTLLVPHSTGGSFPILYYPTTPNRLWCDIQFVEGTTDTGYLHFYTASGGNAGDLMHYLQYEDTPEHPTPVDVDTISCYTLVLTARQVDELFDEKFIKDCWMSWHELFSVFKFENAPESLNLALSIVYTRMENRT
jgi:hypothetical protein